jgi:hypothetical protein
MRFALRLRSRGQPLESMTHQVALGKENQSSADGSTVRASASARLHKSQITDITYVYGTKSPLKCGFWASLKI